MEFLFLVLVASPFAVLLAKPLRRHSDARVRYFGGVLAMLALWLTFDLSIAVMWSTIVGDSIRDEMPVLPLLLAVFGAAQIPAAWVSARIAFAVSDVRSEW